MEIYKDSSETVYLRNYVNGVLTNLDSVPEVELEVIVGDEAESGSGTTLSVATGATGVYSVTIPQSATVAESVAVLYWASEDLAKTDRYNVVTPYIDTYDLISLSPEGTDWEDLKYAEQYARNKINQATGQTFGKTYGSIEVPGRGSDVLPLTKRLIDYSYIYENNSLIIDVEEEENLFGYDIRVSDTNASLLIDRDTDIVEYRATNSSYRGSAFAEDYQYKIVGNFGWNYVPSAIESCAKELVGDYWCNDNKWRESYINKMKSGDWQVEYHPGVYMSTGNSYVDAVLSDYLWHRFVVL